MKKLYMLGMILATASLAGCTLKAPYMPTLPTGDAQEITGTVELTGTETHTGIVPSSAMEEFTGEIDSGVTMVAGSDEITATQSGVSNEIKGLIKTRQTQPKDETKLTEEDIGLMEQIIQKVQNIGK